MKYIIAVFIILLTYSVIAQDLSIATFNCEFLVKSKVHMKFGFNYDLNKESDSIQNLWDSPGYRDAKFEEACEFVAVKIKSIDADVIGLTEIGDANDVAILNQKLADINTDYDHLAICNSTDYSTGQHLVILSRFPITLVKDKFEGRALYFTEPDMDETSNTGLSKGMHAKVNVNGKELDIILIHLKSERGGFESDAQRIAQAELVRREIIPLVKNPNKLVVVMGDLNSEKRHETLLRLRGFDDIYPELLQTGDSNYFEDFSNRWTYNFMGTKEQIDHILLSYSFHKLCKKNNSNNNQWGIRTSIIETTNPFVSDHNALKIELTYR